MAKIFGRYVWTATFNVSIVNRRHGRAAPESRWNLIHLLDAKPRFLDKKSGRMRSGQG
jgi:hypothetical protein